MSEDITTKNVWSTKQLVIIIAFAVSITFSAAMVYAEFVLHGNKLETLEDRMDKRYERTNSNLDNVWGEINEMKKKHNEQ